jgi:hypothetical protein
MDIRFDIVRKVTRPAVKAKGLTLRSVKTQADPAGTAAIMVAESYRDVRESLENYRMMSGADISCRSRGRSLEAFAAGGPESISVLMGFLGGLPWNSEDVLEAAEFYSRYLSETSESGIRPLEIDWTPDDLRISCSCELQPGDTPQAVYAYVSSLLDRYEMGIIKPTEEN